MSWREINDSIRACKATPNPIRCLQQLFIKTRDGHVAMALGTEYEALAQFGEARQWFETAAQRYPKPEFKSNAQAALRRVGSKLQAGATSHGDESHRAELHVVECSKSKIWDQNTDAPRFVPARDAYQGEAIRNWRADTRSSTDRWLVLSARYGFIDADQPIENYDVTFSNTGTGPITKDALRAQVLGQTRWSDKMPIGRFRRVVVHGGEHYVKNVRAAFVDAEIVIEAADGSRSIVPPITEPAGFSWSRTRATAIGTALGQVPESVFVNFDKSEPEWPVVQRLGNWPDERLARLAAMCLGFSDYQLGTGGAEAYWDAIGEEVAKTEVSNSAGILELLIRVCKHSVSSRLAERKLARVKKVIERWSDGSAPDEPKALWRWLAYALNQHPDAKTVVMAMKIVDLMHLAKHEEYLDFGADVPLPVDLRIARLSLTSGLVHDSQGQPISHRDKDANEVASTNRPMLVEAWRSVSQAAGGISLLRIDSLAWQLAEHVKGVQPDNLITQHLLDVGCSRAVASKLASELTRHG